MRARFIEDVRDAIALLCLILVIPGLWIAHGLSWIELPEAVIGATIMGWTLILKDYFEK